MEKRIVLESSAGKLEAAVFRGAGDKAAIITHPHPLYGGDMDNPVVMALAAAYRKAGWSVLRFNFRGTGRSQGEYSGGRGEVEDVQAAVSFMREQAGGSIHLAGYSFGAWVNSLWAVRHRDHSIPLVMVSPPVNFLSFDEVNHLPGLRLVVAGGLDEIAPADRILEMVPHWNPSADLMIMEEADHFYGGFWQSMTDIVVQWLREAILTKA